jgi:hypothetical protein
VGVKNALRLPALYLLFFILLVLLLTGISLLELRVGNFGETGRAARALAASRLVPILLERFPAAALFALVLTLFPLYHRPGNRFLCYLLPMGAAFAVLAFGGLALRRLPAPPRPPAPSVAGYFLPRHFQEFGDGVLYLDGVQGSRLEGVVAQGPAAAGPRLGYLGSSQASFDGKRLIVRGGGRGLSAPDRPAHAVLLAEAKEPAQQLRAGFTADLQFLARALDARYGSSPSSYHLTCLALVFSFFTAGMFFRISRWPLANVLLAFLVMRGYLFLYRWLREGVAGELADLIGAPRLAAYLPEAALLTLGVLLLLIDLLFLPFERRRGELAGA